MLSTGPLPTSASVSLSLISVLAVAVGGTMGALTRYGVMLVASGLAWSPLAATLIVNCLGSAVAGAWLARSQVVSTSGSALGEWHALVAIGFLGAFTTMSTLTVEALQLWQSRGFGLALAVALGHFALCLLSVGLGHYLYSTFLAPPRLL